MFPSPCGQAFFKKLHPDKLETILELFFISLFTCVAATSPNILFSVFHQQARPRETLFARLEPPHKIAGLAGKDEGRSRELPTRHGKYQVFSASRRTRERFFLSVILLLFVFESFFSFSFIRWFNIFFPKFLKFQVSMCVENATLRRNLPAGRLLPCRTSSLPVCFPHP